MADAFRILRQLAKNEGIVDPSSRKAVRWFREQVISLYGGESLKTGEVLTNTKENLYKQKRIEGGTTAIGKMYTFIYHPLGKSTLPYYDLFPLTIMLSRYNDGFLGLNLHYISPKYRQILLGNLSGIMTNQRFDHTTRLRLTYNMVKNWKKLKYAKPCIKRYKTKKIRSRVLQIPASDWNAAIYLPFERFRKRNKVSVWQDSKTHINKG